MARTDEEFAVAAWYKQLRDTSNPSFIPLFFDTHRYIICRGGAGSGKSIFAGRKVLERCTSEPGHRVLVCRKVAKTLRDSCFAQLVGQALDYYPTCGIKINRGDLRITFKNGSEIIFAGLDDVEKLKSIYDITGIWIEEASELEESDFNQLDIRLRTQCPYYLQMILTFNPISITHWLKKRFFDVTDDRARVHNSTYKDNRFLTPEAITTLENFAKTDPYYYMVYALNQWGVTGNTVFSGEELSHRLTQLVPPKMRGYYEYDYDGLRITNIRWHDDDTGPISIYILPDDGRPYVIGADTAGDGSDYFAAHVLDNLTGVQAAVFHHQYDEDTFAQQMYCLGTYYNKALIGVEANFSSFPVKELERLHYPNQYVREREDTYTGELRKSLGFKTTNITRPILIAELIRAVRGRADLINDEATILEMMTFVRNEDLRPEAEPGAHDDLVMSLGIAWYIRPQGRTYIQTDTDQNRSWTADQWEDWQNASPEERDMIVQLWGRPPKRR